MEFNLASDRRPLEEIVQIFFPVIESRILADTNFAQSATYISSMILIAKVFYICN